MDAEVRVRQAGLRCQERAGSPSTCEGNSLETIKQKVCVGDKHKPERKGEIERPLWLGQGHSHPLCPSGFVSCDPQRGQSNKHKNI